MPVIDHPVHPMTVGGGQNGCHNRPEFKPGYYAPNRVYLDGGKWETEQKFIPHAMSTECRYSTSLTDAKCDGCPHRGSGEEYAERIRKEAA